MDVSCCVEAEVAAGMREGNADAKVFVLYSVQDSSRNESVRSEPRFHGRMECDACPVIGVAAVVTLVANFMVPDSVVAHRLLNAYLTLTLLSAARV